jgi:hypothetical protein
LGDGGEDAAARGWGLREYDRRPWLQDCK